MSPISTKNTFTKFSVPKTRFHRLSWELRSEPCAQNAMNKTSKWPNAAINFPMYVLWFFYDLFARKPKLSTLLPFTTERKKPQLFSFQLGTLFPHGINERLIIFPRTGICREISTNDLINSSTLPYKATTPHNSSIHSDERVTLEMPIFHSGNSTFINSFDATQFLKFSGLSRCCLSSDRKMRWSKIIHSTLHIKYKLLYYHIRA